MMDRFQRNLLENNMVFWITLASQDFCNGSNTCNAKNTNLDNGSVDIPCTCINIPEHPYAYQFSALNGMAA